MRLYRKKINEKAVKKIDYKDYIEIKNAFKKAVLIQKKKYGTRYLEK